MKKLLPGEVRFIVKTVDKKFRVYDRAAGSYPYQTVELGLVAQDFDKETEAQLESDRLNEKFVQAPKKQVQAANTKNTKTTGSSKTVQAEAPAPAAAEFPDPEVLEYDMTEDQKKRHEEEVLSGKY